MSDYGYSKEEVKYLGRRFFELDVPVYFSQIEKWVRNGASEEQIIERFGVSKNTWIKWKKLNDGDNELVERLKKGREVSVSEIENEMYTHAKGRYVEDVKTIVEVDGKRRIEKTKKYVAGNPTLQMFILQNRLKDEWKNVQYINQESKVEFNKKDAEKAMEELNRMFDDNDI